MIATRVGYAGGTTPDPTYTNLRDHTESIQIDYDPAVISYEDLLAEFWASHVPTRPSRTRQYASVIFYADEAQRKAAEDSKRRFEAHAGKAYTDIVPLERFYLAEEYHQHYYAKHGMLSGEACGVNGR